MSTFIECINNNKYLNTKQKIQSHNNESRSLSSLIKEPLNQSCKIRMGIGLESVLLDYIVKNNNNLESIKTKNIKGSKEKDHLFRDDVNKIIYYAEIKSNLMLDSEKTPSTRKKVSEIIDELSAEHEGYKIVGNLVVLRYTSVDKIPHDIINKYTNTKVVGINDYLSLLGVPVIENYVDGLNICAEKIRETSAF